MNTVCVSGRVPMAFSMSKYCVISSKSTTSFDDAPLICSFDVKSLMEFLRPSTMALIADAVRAGARLPIIFPAALDDADLGRLDALDAAGHLCLSWLAGFWGVLAAPRPPARARVATL